MKVGIKRPSPAIVISVIALIVTLSGTAYAALAPNSVGPRQIKPKAVTGAKFADGSIKTDKVAKTTLTGDDINLGALGTVPRANDAQSVGNTEKVAGHSASCPGGTLLIRGRCFDAAPLGPILGVWAAADACRERGGYLPTPEALYSVRTAIDLGNGTGTNSVFADSIYANTSGVDYATTVVDATGEKTVKLEKNIENEKKEIIGKEVIANYHYLCSYPLVR